MSLRALARINLAAIERNVTVLRALLAPGTRFCAVVKANASGHGAVPAARAALAAGADSLAVATVLEAAELRSAGLSVPVLIMGAVSAEELPLALETRAALVTWSDDFVDSVSRVATQPVDVHVKLDTGMGRLGTRRVAEALAVADRLLAPDSPLRLAGAMTHLATADDDPEFMRAQLEVFAPFVTEMRRRQAGIVAHAANSAATVSEPASHYDMVRCGIALHGCDPMNAAPEHYGLEPALELSSYVAAVKPAAAGESVGYGRRFVADADTWVATVPIGYADGIRRALTDNCDVLIAGQRFPLIGTVSMDNVTADLGSPLPADVVPGATATLIGRDGDERQTVEDLARRIDSIPHEVLCGISARVVRRYHRDGEPVAGEET
ncbi:MAG: alanine racemase [Solirubrobacteraceae bacterium]|jgi:alanine racemase|nr:alanine racemase [Solirubrobacteraceae bacterium]